MQLTLLVLVPLLANAAPRCLTVAEAEAAIGALPDLSVKLTPPLPVTWPISAPSPVRYFDFRFEPLPTGVVAYGIDTPSTEFTVPLDGTAVRRRALGKRLRLGRWSPPLEEGQNELGLASALLLKLTCEGRAPTELEAAQLRAGYGAWLEREPLVRGWLARQAAPFVAWLSARK